MSYTITLRCGCSVYVSCHPQTHVAHTRVIEARGEQCPERRHERGVRLSDDEISVAGPVVSDSVQPERRGTT